MRVELIGMRMLALATLVLVAGPRLQGEDLNAALDLAIQRETSALAPDSLHFPEPKDALTPPPWIAAAGKDFVAAWWEWASVMKPPADGQKTAPLKRDDLINAAKDSEPFADLIRRCINSDPPPTLDEFRPSPMKH